MHESSQISPLAPMALGRNGIVKLKCEVSRLHIDQMSASEMRGDICIIPNP